jgi:hypothetical protein
VKEVRGGEERVRGEGVGAKKAGVYTCEGR